MSDDETQPPHLPTSSEQLSDSLHCITCHLQRHSRGGNEYSASASDGVDSCPQQTVPGGEHQPGSAVDQSLACPEGGPCQLDGVGGDAGDHVHPVRGHRPQAGGAGGEDSLGGGDDVVGDGPDEPGAWGAGGGSVLRQTQSGRGELTGADCAVSEGGEGSRSPGEGGGPRSQGVAGHSEGGDGDLADGVDGGAAQVDHLAGGLTDHSHRVGRSLPDSLNPQVGEGVDGGGHGVDGVDGEVGHSVDGVGDTVHSTHRRV